MIRDLGSLGGPRRSAYDAAYAINQHGQVVGAAITKATTADGIPLAHAFLWQAGRMVDLGVLPPGRVREYRGKDNASSAVAINDSGQVAGVSTSSAGTSRAFVWQRGKLVELDPGHRAPTYDVARINNRGEVIGAAPLGRAFLWRNGKMIMLVATPASWYRYVYALNDHGQAVGKIARSSETPWDAEWSSMARAVLWQDGKATVLAKARSEARAINEHGLVVGSSAGVAVSWRRRRLAELPVPQAMRLSSSEAVAVNGRGDIIGTGSDVLGEDAYHGLLWRGGKVTDLGRLPGTKNTWPLQISDRGQIIGFGYSEDWNVDARAFVWQDGRLTYLGALPGDTVSQALAINERNQIVGWSGTKAGRRHAVIWTLANPR